MMRDRIEANPSKCDRIKAGQANDAGRGGCNALAFCWNEPAPSNIKGTTPSELICKRIITQGSSFLATLGWRAKSLWDFSPAETRVQETMQGAVTEARSPVALFWLEGLLQELSEGTGTGGHRGFGGSGRAGRQLAEEADAGGGAADE
jgi:hypothetical protein